LSGFQRPFHQQEKTIKKVDVKGTMWRSIQSIYQDEETDDGGERLKGSFLKNINDFN